MAQKKKLKPGQLRYSLIDKEGNEVSEHPLWYNSIIWAESTNGFVRDNMTGKTYNQLGELDDPKNYQ